MSEAMPDPQEILSRSWVGGWMDRHVEFYGAGLYVGPERRETIPKLCPSYRDTSSLLLQTLLTYGK